MRQRHKETKSDVFNLGNGDGFSVKQVLQTSEKVTGKKIKVKIGSRRPGDPGKIVASSAKAQKVLGWRPGANLEEIVRSAWKWEQHLQSFKNNFPLSLDNPSNHNQYFGKDA